MRGAGSLICLQLRVGGCFARMALPGFLLVIGVILYTCALLPLQPVPASCIMLLCVRALGLTQLLAFVSCFLGCCFRSMLSFFHVRPKVEGSQAEGPKLKQR